MTVFNILQNLVIIYVRWTGNFKLVITHSFIQQTFVDPLYSKHCPKSWVYSDSHNILGPFSRGTYNLSSYMKFEKVFNRFKSF